MGLKLQVYEIVSCISIFCFVLSYFICFSKLFVFLYLHFFFFVDVSSIVFSSVLFFV